MNSANTSYYFLPYLRTGLAANLKQPDSDSQRAVLDVTLNIKANKTDGTVDEKIVNKFIHLYGPGDITGFDKKNIVGHDPADQVGDFEPNFFPAIQFKDPDFLWRYNAGVPDADDNLSPWLTLIVLVAEDTDRAKKEFDTPETNELLRRTEQKLPPYIENVSIDNLPDLTESWRWAHVQITGAADLGSGGTTCNKEVINDILYHYPERLSCRLLCARRLQPGILYNAFLVPTFKLSLAAAGLLDSAEGIPAQELAWLKSGEESICLPYYYRWEFRTGQSGDFEQLVRRLEPRPLTKVGLRPMDCSDIGCEISSSVTGDGILELEGALKTIDTISSFWGKDRLSATQPEPAQKELAGLLNRNSSILTKQVVTISDIAAPVVINDAEIIITGNEAVVSWKTGTDTPSTVKYGKMNLNHRVNDSELKQDHSLLIDNLDSNTVYRLCIVATAHNEQQSVSGVVEFCTAYSAPLVLPPMYGRWYVKRDSVNCQESDSWFDELNLDPRHRAAAGIGAEVVRQHQEALMASAWDQVGEINKANDLLNRTNLGMEVSSSIFQRFQELSEDNFFIQSRPLHSRMRYQNDKTISGLLATSRMPKAAFNYSLRRIRRPCGPIRKRQILAKGITGQLQSDIFLQRFNGESLFTAARKSVEPGGTKVMMQVKSSSTSGSPSSVPKIPVIPNSEILLRNSNNLNRKNKSIARTFAPVLTAMLSMQNDSAKTPDQLNLTALKQEFINKLNPQLTISKRANGLLQTSSGKMDQELPDTVMASPDFSHPMYEPLYALSKEWLIPGIQNISPNTISLLQTNNRFIEAFLCGCNHEFASELLWREYPTDQRGTYFRKFWENSPTPKHFLEKYESYKDDINFNNKTELDRELWVEQQLEQQTDIPPVHTWDNTKRLGSNSNAKSDQLVLLIRGDLLKKYPAAVVYALPRKDVYDTVTNQPKVGKPSENIHYPVFSVTVPSDITLLGFNLGNIDYNNWFFVIEERVSESRFGLDVPANVDLTKWDDLSWGHFDFNSDGVLDTNDNQYGQYLDGFSPQSEIIPGVENAWRTSSATIAKHTHQKPVRIIINATQLIP